MSANSFAIPAGILLVIGAFMAMASPAAKKGDREASTGDRELRYQACVAQQDAEYIRRCMRESLSEDLQRSG